MKSILPLCLLITFSITISAQQLPVLVKNCTVEDSIYSNPKYFVVCSGKIYFQNDNDTAGAELWISDGTTIGTYMVKDIEPGSFGSSPREFVELNGKVFFGATTQNEGAEVWITDGTDAGTHIIKDINPGPASSRHSTAYSPVVYNGRIYFRATDGVHGQELWVTDGTDTGTHMVKDAIPGSGDGAAYFAETAVCNGKLFYSGYDLTNGNELWMTDGTDTGTHIVKDIHPGPLDGGASTLYAFGTKVLFVGNDSNNNYEPWISDGSNTGTHQLKDINPGVDSSSIPVDFYGYNGKIYFTATDGAHGREMWTTDGTDAGTTMVVDLAPGIADGIYDAFFKECNGKLYFADANRNLGVSDGTPAGTATFFTFNNGAIYPYFYVADHKLFFAVYNTQALNEGALWVSDGTAANTQLIKPAGSTNPRPFYNPVNSNTNSPLENWVVYNNALYFAANYFENIGYEMYKVDTTPLAVRVVNINDLPLAIHPNPAREKVTVSLEAIDKSTADITLIDMLGRELRNWGNQPILPGKNDLQLTLPAGISAGTYLLQIHTTQSSQVAKLSVD
ncbi:MAG: T9SS type A sorting domain-containing protein [Bacteroidetes bacterium]|nr:T9SS type A sorting domain-containing protein [Bacteroidota bacterium]